MRFFMVAVVGAALLSAAVLADEKPAPGSTRPELKDVQQKVSYGFGLFSGKALKAQGIQGVDLDVDLFSQGLKDAFAGANARLTDEQFKEALMAFQKEMGEHFLAENKKKTG